MLIGVFLLLLQGAASIPFIDSPEVQQQSQRHFKNGGLKKIDVIRPDSLFNAGVVKTNQNDIYVLDYRPVPRILKINPESHSTIAQFGKRRGRGPGELLNPTDFDIAGNGSVWIADNPSSRIVIFDPDGKYRDEWIIRHIPYKISITEQDYILIHSSTDPTIKLVDSMKNILWNSEQLVENPRQWANVLSGFLLAQNKRLVLFVSNYAGIIVQFDERGLIKFIRRTIGYDQNVIGNPIPGLDYLAYQVDREKLNHAIANGFIKDQKIYVLVQFYGDDRYQVIDVYSTKEGAYLYSIRVSEPVRAIGCLAPTTLVGLQADQIILWHLN